MKVIILQDDVAHDLAIAIGVHIPLTNRPELRDLMVQLDGPSEYVAAHRDNDLPLIFELLQEEERLAEEQLRDHQYNMPEFVPDDKARLEYATEVYERLREQL